MADQEPTAVEKTTAPAAGETPEPAAPVTNPKRVVRTYASDVASLTGAPALAKPAAAPLPHPAAVAAISHAALPPMPAPIAVAKPIPAHVPPPAPEKPVASLQSAVSKIPLPPLEPETPHLPPLKKQTPAATPVRQEPPSRPWPKPPETTREWERPATPKEPSFISKLFGFIFGTSSGATTNTYPNTSIPAPAPVWQKPLPPQVSEVAAPSLKPATEVADDAHEREAVLARLQARVKTYQAGNPIAPPVFPTPKPETAPRPQPVARPVAVPFPSPETAEPERLRTYTDDFSSRIDTQKASAFSVYAAQADASGVSTVSVSVEPKKEHLGLAYVLGGAALVIGGSLLLYFGYTYLQGNAPVPVVTTAPPTLVSGDDQVAIDGTGPALLQKLAAAASEPLSVGNIRIVYLQATATSTAPGGALIKALAFPAPDILLRNIGDTSTVGIVHAGSETRVFFILAATSYERTFAGMLSWEASMASDLALLYPPLAIAPTPVPEVATTTATSIATTTKAKIVKAVTPPPVLVPVVVQPHFVDEVIDSHDVRAFKDAHGKTVLLYGYRDQKTLIIARDETAFSVLLARLSATQSQ